MNPHIDIPRNRIVEFCQKWRIKELSVFGSALREDFRPDSDLDMLMVLEDGAHWTLFDHVRAQDELKDIVGREVDLVDKGAIRNPFRRRHILDNHEVIYAA